MNYLNPIQLEAVKTTEGYLCVIAGAGSGKTRMLVSRYVYIIKELGINPNNVLCLTFSNKTAGEMKKRIKSILGDEDLSFVTTYHGLGARIISENTNLLFFPSSFQIIDREDQKDILTEIYAELEIKLDSITFENIIDKMEIFKSDLRYIKYMKDTSTSEVEYATYDTNSEIIRKYLTVQKQHFLIDFSDLINYAIYLLENYSEVKDKWQNRLNYILVDEFQDSTEKEVRLVNLISGLYENLMVVGDPDQNIYEWRGSLMRYLVDFNQNHVNTKTIVMNQNYRSTSKILNCANNIIKYNQNRYPKDLYTDDVGGEDVVYFQGESDYKEAEWICNKIKYLHDEEDEPYSNIAILYRSSFLSRVIEGKLNESAIPYEIIGGIKFFQRMEIRDVISYMKLCCYDDDYALKRMINTPKRQFGRMKMDTLQKMRKAKDSLYETLKDNLESFKNNKIKEFVNVIEYVRNNVNNMTVLSIFEYLLDKMGYQKYLRELGSEDRLNNLAELRRVIQGLLIDDDSIKLENALSYFALQSDYETEDADKVKLMTCHTSKGLEYSTVFVIALNEGSFPSKKTIESRDIGGLEEERRLCYVALTRAKKRLYLTSALGYNHEGTCKIPSRFLDEIGQDNYVSINVKTKVKKVEINLKHKALDQVTHKIFGKGTIVDIDYQCKSYKILFEISKLPRNVDFNYQFEEDIKAIDVEEQDEQFEGFSKAQIESLKMKAQEMNNKKYEDMNTSENFENPEPVTYMFDGSLKPNLKGLNRNENLWNDPSVPKSGWYCIGITDLGYASGFCSMCGQNEIRYLHHMKHNDYNHILSVGCVCASKMENDSIRAQSREINFKNKLNRRLTFLRKDWKLSRNGNWYTKYNNHSINLYRTKDDKFISFIDNKRLNGTYDTKNEILNAIFDFIDDGC